MKEFPVHTCTELCRAIQSRMCEEGQSDFRSLVGKIGWLVGHRRPDMVFVTSFSGGYETSCEDHAKIERGNNIDEGPSPGKH